MISELNPNYSLNFPDNKIHNEHLFNQIEEIFHGNPPRLRNILKWLNLVN